MNHPASAEPHPVILAIETSCDDTAAAVVRGTTVLSNVISTQAIHNTWGGIVPELASREHVKAIGPIVEGALADAGQTYASIDAIAVTYGPGLPGSLLVGTQFAKGLATRLASPLLPIHHIEAHVYSGYLEEPELPMPSVCLVVSGGHTALFRVDDWKQWTMIGATRDDAAGEAFDKVARMLGLGYPGGPLIDALARDGDPLAFDLPRGLINDGSFNFSFSGLKTAVRKLAGEVGSTRAADVAASVQRAIVEVLVAKTVSAAEASGVQAVTIAGGVSANSELRSTMQTACEARGWMFVAPRGTYCVDNAAMIGFVAAHRLRESTGGSIDFGIEPRALRAVR